MINSKLLSFRNRWIELAFLFLCFLLAFYPQLYSLVNTWYKSEDYSHAFLIIPICLWLIWQKKDELEVVKSDPSIWGLYIVILSLILYFLSSLAEITTSASFFIIISVWGIIIYLYGFPLIRLILFPLVFLFFMIPIPSQIYTSLTLPLQLIVTKASVAVTSITGIPIYREGNVIFIPEMTLQVVDACSGMRSMIALLTISAVFSFLTLRLTSNRLLLFLSGIPIAIAVNIFRVSVMILLSFYGSFDVLKEPWHTGLGLSVFVLAFILLFSFGGAFSWMEKIFVKKY